MTSRYVASNLSVTASAVLGLFKILYLCVFVLCPCGGYVMQMTGGGGQP